MQTQTMTAGRIADEAGKSDVIGWLIFSGIALMGLGAVAVIYDVTATVVSVFLFGCLLALAGVMQIVHGIQVRAQSGFFLYLLDGILRATIGVFLVVYPASGAQTLTLVLAFYFIAGGL